MKTILFIAFQSFVPLKNMFGDNHVHEAVLSEIHNEVRRPVSKGMSHFPR